MAGDDETNINWKFSLDGADFKKEAGAIGEAMKALGEQADLPIGKLNLLIGTSSLVIGALAAIGASIELVKMAEDASAVNTQFDIMAKSAGLAGNEIKEKLIKAAGGMASENEILAAANKQIVAMGDSAARMPEIMTLARKAAALTGEDVVSVFNNMSHAMESGNQRALKQYNIFIDSKKAVKEYADAHGVLSNELSESGRRQALLNASIDAGQKSLKDVDPEMRKVGNTLQQLKTTSKEVGEAIATAFEVVAGNAVRNFLGIVQSLAGQVKSAIGMATKSGEAQIESQIQFFETRIESLKKKPGLFDFAIGFNRGKNEEEISRLSHSLDLLREKKKQLDESSGTKGSGSSVTPSDEEKEKSKLNTEEIKKNNLKFNQDLLKMREETLKASLNNIKTDEQANAVAESEKAIREEQFQTRREQIIQQYSKNDPRRNKELNELTENHKQKELAAIDDVKKYKEKAAENSLKHEEKIGSQMTAASHKRALKAAKDWEEAGADGGHAMMAMEDRSIQAFTAIGEGSKSASDIAKGFFFGMIGDVAKAKGEYMVLDAFDTFPAVKVPELAAGAGLIALGSFLSSQAGSSSVGGMPSSSGGGSGGMSSVASSVGDSTGTTSAANASQVTPQKTFTLNVHGNVWGSQETAMQVVDMFRKAADATDYKYNQIGN